MNTKVVYVLVSNKNDYYVEMLQLSLYSLRIFHPDDIVEVVMDEKTYSPDPKVDYNEKLIRQQYEPMTPQEQYELKMEALKEIRESGIDYCSCPETCPHHGKCWEWRLTEGSMKQWKPHKEGEIPRQYHSPPDQIIGNEDR